MAALTEEQSLLKDQAQAWVREQAPVVKFREMRDSGVEQAFTPDDLAGDGGDGLDRHSGAGAIRRFRSRLPDVRRRARRDSASNSSHRRCSHPRWSAPRRCCWAATTRRSASICRRSSTAQRDPDAGGRRRSASCAGAHGAAGEENRRMGFALTRCEDVRAGRHGGHDVRRRRAHARCGRRHCRHHAVPRSREREGSVAPAPQHVRQPRLRESRIRERRSGCRRGARQRRQRLCAARWHSRPGACGPRRRDARHGGAGVRHDAVVSEDARAVRQGDRLVPGARPPRGDAVHEHGTRALVRGRRAAGASMQKRDNAPSCARCRRARSAISCTRCRTS